MLLPRFVFAVTWMLSLATLALAENWPQWRGPKNDGISNEKNIPTKWNESENIAWKLPLPGNGSSTPCIWKDRIFLTSEDGSAIVLMCIDTSGKELWKKPFGVAGKSGRADEGNRASPSCSTDGQYVWAFCGSGELVCYDLEGKEIWKLDVQKQYGRFGIQFGMHTTPVLDGDRLYLQLIHDNAALVVALESPTGKEIWKVTRESDGRAECLHSYASPVIWRNGDQAYLITHGNDYAIAHALKDGREIWRVGELNPKTSYNPTLRFVASPLATPNLIVIPSAKRGPVVGLKPDAKGLINAKSEGELWRMPKNTPDVSSPLLHEGLVYLSREDGTLFVVDASNGQEVYNQRIFTDRYRASPVYADGAVYVTGRKGVITCVKTGREFKLISENRLPDDMAASPAISGGRIYLRGFKNLWAIGK